MAAKGAGAPAERGDPSPLPPRGGSSDLYRSAGQPVLVDARTTISYYHRPILVDS